MGAYLVPNTNPNHCVAIVPKLQDLVLLQHQVSQSLVPRLWLNHAKAGWGPGNEATLF